jgi:hypothetical protein
LELRLGAAIPGSRAMATPTLLEPGFAHSVD